MSQLSFSLRYAFRNLSRSRRWSIFAIFCIAAGVATVVALRSLGLAIGDSLIENVRNSNHGDITIQDSSANPFSSFFSGASEEATFTDRQIETVSEWVHENGGAITIYSTVGNLQIAKTDSVTVGRPQFLSALLIDPQTFPPTQPIRAIDPAGVPINDLLTAPRQVVISRNFAEADNIQVNDKVRVSGTTEEYTVVGIVATEEESSIRNIFASFFGFAYFDIAEAESLQISPNPNTISLTLPENFDLNDAVRDIHKLLSNRGISYTRVDDLLTQNQTIGDILGKLIVTMGLGALLIGGVGIINTMLVMVGRRTNEIAALKTFGLKGRQIAQLFFAEAFLLGAAGSIGGTILGILISGAVNRYGELFLQQRLVWRIYPEAILYGLALGMIVTLVFGIVPILTAVRVRPAIILRPNETNIPAVGCLQSLIAILAVVFIIGAAAGHILGSIIIGIIGVAFTLVFMAFLVGVFWVIVWLVGKLPSFGIIDLRLALRNLSARRLRTATTLLALSAGMFALSIITFVGAGTREILQFQLSEGLGGNVFVFPYANVLSQDLGQFMLRAQLNNIDGIDNIITSEQYSLDLIAVDGEPAKSIFTFFPGFEDDMPASVRRELERVKLAISIENTTVPRPAPTISEGRALTPEDENQRVIVLPEEIREGITPRIEVGSVLSLDVDNHLLDFTVVGIIPATNSLSFDSVNARVPTGALKGEKPFVTTTVLQVPPENLNEVLVRLSSFVPPVLALDITFIDGFITRIIDQMSAIPTIVGVLSLFSAAVIMANTVALATLERRRQIGILKAVGLKGRRVLLVMLIENTLIGLLGAVLGIGLSALMAAVMSALGQGVAIPIPANAMTTAVLLVIAAIVIAWIATFASASVAIRERVTNVLRYE